MRNGLLVLALILAAVCAVLVINQRDEGVFEKSGRKVDSAIEDAGDQVEKATDKF